MARLGSTRRTRRLGALALAAFWALGLVAEPVRLLAPLLHPGESPVSRSEIRAPGHEHGVCEHHPQGCPKDCFCPKLDPQAAAAAAEARAPQGTVSEPALDHCSDTRGNPPHPRGQAAFVFEPFVFRSAPLRFTGRVLPQPPLRPAGPFREPPIKVPLA